MPQQGMQHHPAGVVVRVELAGMQHPEMPPLEMDPHAGLGLLQGVMPLLTGMHPLGGMALLPLLEGRGKHPHRPGVGVGGRLSLDEAGVYQTSSPCRGLPRWWTMLAQDFA